MAVATDFHRDFLIPERAEFGAPDNERLAFRCPAFILLLSVL
jgi:hypothetical protein